MRAAKQKRHVSYQIAGTCRMIAQLCERATPAKESVPTPSAVTLVTGRSYYLHCRLRGLQKERALWKSLLVSDIAHVVGVRPPPASASRAAHLGEFKGLAILQHDWRESMATENSKESIDYGHVTPERVLAAANALGLELSLDVDSARYVLAQGPYRALWIAVEYAKAPLPAFWSPMLQPDGTYLYVHAKDRTLTETAVHPLHDAHVRLARRFQLADKNCNKPLSRKPELAWYFFAVDGKPRLVEFNYGTLNTKPSAAPLLRQSDHRFAPMPVQESHSSLLTKRARDAILELLAAPPRFHRGAEWPEYLSATAGRLVEIERSYDEQRVLTLTGTPRELSDVLVAADCAHAPALAPKALRSSARSPDSGTPLAPHSTATARRSTGKLCSLRLAHPEHRPRRPLRR